MSFRSKTISGFKWSLIDNISKYAVTFVVSIVLARLLTPKEFGIVGLGGIFLAISRVFIDGGMGDALIRKKDTTSVDYDSVFAFNLILSVFFYGILFFSSVAIADFFHETELSLIIRISGLSLIIGSFSIVQLAILRKQIDFKRQAVISFISSFGGGIISVFLALLGFSYWSLIVPSLVSGAASAIILTFTSSWRPNFTISLACIKEHFSFSSKIIATSFVYVVYQNMFSAFVGRNFSIIDLGFYYKADNLQKLPTTTLDTAIRHVTYPVLATMQSDRMQLKNSYKVLLKHSSLVNGLIMMLLAALSEKVVLVLFGAKWMPSVPYLQLLCFIGIVFPLVSINANLLNVKGRSDITFFVIAFKVFLSLPALVLGYYYGITTMILGMFLSGIFHYFIVVYITSKQIDYGVLEQLRDVSKGLLFSIAVSLPVYLIGRVVNYNPFFDLALLLIVSLCFIIIVGRFSRNTEYSFFEISIRERLSSMLSRIKG